MSLYYQSALGWNDTSKITDDVLLNSEEIELEFYSFFFFFEVIENKFAPIRGDKVCIESGLVKPQMYTLEEFKKILKLSTSATCLMKNTNDEMIELCDNIDIISYIDWNKTLEILRDNKYIDILPSECDNPNVKYRFKYDNEYLEGECLNNKMFLSIREYIIELYQKFRTLEDTKIETNG